MKTMKTIRQIADEVGVSKTAVSNQIEKLGLKDDLRKVANQFVIDERQEKLIKQAFSGKIQAKNANKSQSSQTKSRVKLPEADSQIDEILAVLQFTIDMLQGQLEAKDRQIEQQAQTIAQLTEALTAAQALHAGTIQQQISSGEESVGNEPELKGKKNLFSKLFGR